MEDIKTNPHVLALKILGKTMPQYQVREGFELAKKRFNAKGYLANVISYGYSVDDLMAIINQKWGASIQFIPTNDVKVLIDNEDTLDAYFSDISLLCVRLMTSKKLLCTK